jgi:prepilin-type N-terminal cleavage/methylation domain-containing protein
VRQDSYVPEEKVRNRRIATGARLNFMTKQKGFSLIELLIVVAIILIIAAIAIPNLMRARMAANDSSAAGSMHAIAVAEAGYFGAYQTVGFPATLSPLGGASPCTPGVATACLIDQSLASGGPKSGYSFAATGSAGAGSAINNQFYATATPTSDLTGTRAYCAADDLVLRLQPSGNTTMVASYAACWALSPESN